MGALRRGAAAAALLAAACVQPARKEAASAPAPAPQAAAPAPAPPPETQEAWTCPAETATVVAVGDIRLGGPVGEIARKEGPSAPVRGVLAWLSGDVRVGNLETAVTARGVKARKKWNFRSPPKSLDILKAAGFDILNLANNHVMDYGPQGLADTIAALDAHAFAHVGAGVDLRAALEPVFVDVNGIRLGFLGLTHTLGDNHFAGTRKPGVAYADLDRMGAWIRAAKKRCDVLLVCYHSGVELAPEPHELQRAFGHAAVDAGADAVLAHHPHVIQAVEIYKGRPILHSLGNFLFVSPTPSTRPTVIARLAVGKSGPCAIDFVPVDTGYGRLGPASPEGAADVRAALDRDGALTRLPGALRFLHDRPAEVR